MSDLVKGFKSKDGQTLLLDYSGITVERDSNNNPVNDIHLAPSDIGAASADDMTALQAHVEGLTASDVGARPVDWMPTAADVGASAIGHKHTKSEITDFPTSMTPTTHNHDASEITNGTLSVARGGTGATTAAAALANLELTATAAELNIMDGVTATTAEINKLDGLTATTTELNYVGGVTSNIQTQLNAKQATITGAASTVTSSNLTAKRIVITDDNGKIAATSTVDTTELSYLNGVTSAIQTQLNGKQATISGGASTIASSNLTASRALVSDSSGKVAVSAVTSTELGYLDGVTSAIQTQLNGKAANSNMTGATSSAAGGAGLVPAPAAGKQASFLRGDGTWAVPTDTNTDTKVNVTLGTTTKAYLLGTSTTPTSTATAVTTISDTGVYLDTTAGKLTATSFAGSGASLTSLNASNISSGTLAAARLATSGVTAGTYGPSAAVTGSDGATMNVPEITVDTYGRVTKVTNRVYTAKNTANTDTKVNVKARGTTKAYLLATTTSPTSSNVAQTAVAETGVYLDTTAGKLVATSVYGAVWNDYAEYREANTTEPGRVVCEYGDDTLKLATERLQPGANVVSDTFGFAIGETESAKTPIAVSGRVLVYPYEDRNTYQPGDAVCAAPGGTVSKMSREEIINYPERIVGTVSAVPTYSNWGENNVPVNGRIWIKVK